MPSPITLEFDALLQPLDGDLPAGPPTAYTLKQELEDARKEVNPEDFDPGDPSRPEAPKRADWPHIARQTKEALARSSKDLMLAARLTEALVRQHGYAGLRDGLHLMRLLVEQAWDRIHPDISDGDLEVRATPFNWLDDPDRGARFPHTVRSVPIVVGGDYAFSLVDWRLMQEGRGNVNRDDFEKALTAMPRELCDLKADDLAAALGELNELQKQLEGKLGNTAPGFSSLRPALQDAITLMNLVRQRKGPVPGAAEESPAGDGTAGVPGAPGAAPRTATREGLFQQLQNIAQQLKQMEPQSPIPYLIGKAIELGALPFPVLMKALIRDSNVLTEMNRELGIKEEQS